MTLKEYIDRINQRTRKSGLSRKIGIKSLIGNPRLIIPKTGNEKEDAKRRYRLTFE